MSELIASQLTGYDLGRVLQYTRGGATYRGALNKVEHSRSFNGDRRVFLHLKAGDWSHMQHIAGDAPVQLEVAA